MYQKAFYETCELMEGMSTNLRKLLVTGSAQQEQLLLSEIARQAQGAQDDLSQLPLGDGAVSATIKFVNQAGDFATSLAGRLAGGAAISDADYENISALSESAGELSARLGQLLARYESGEDVFAGDMGETGQRASTRSPTPAVSYPALLYDGPFSDASRTDGVPRPCRPAQCGRGRGGAGAARLPRRGGGDGTASGKREQHPRGLL